MEMLEKRTLDETRRKLKDFVHRRVRDKAVAEDIVQDVFIKVFTRLGQLRDADRMRAWIYQVTRNAINDHFRAGTKVVAWPGLSDGDDPRPLNDCVTECLGEMLMTLPEKYKQALVLAEIESLSQTDLAERLKISYSGAKSRVQRARKLLRQKMDDAYIIKMDAYGNVTVCQSRVPCACSSNQ